MTLEQAKISLRALEDYEMSLFQNIWDCPDRVWDELEKILVAKTKLRAIIHDARRNP